MGSRLLRINGCQWGMYFLDRVGLGVSDFVYRIFALFVLVVSGIDSVHGFGAWIRCIGMAMAIEKREIIYYKKYIDTTFWTAIALQSIHLFQSLL